MNLNLNENRVLVAMSGGVDSSVTALLLKRAGYEVIGVTMKLWESEQNESFQRCCSPSDIRDARRVADALGINFYVLNLMEEFNNNVVKKFIEEYANGRTPNPCILCNRWMKFHYLFKKADELGCMYLATGHYARIRRDDGGIFISKSKDRKKDQSYFLFNTPAQILSRLLFPAGEYFKNEIRSIAEKNNLRVATKPDSQEICFIPNGNYSEFLVGAGLKPKKGPIVDSGGKVLGFHNGYFNFTIGQREGLRISCGRKLYVIKIDPESNTVVVGEDSETLVSQFGVNNTNWFLSLSQGDQIECKVKIRYKHPEAPCKVRIEDGGRATVTLLEPQRAVTPGQAAVFYDGEILIGGGWIERT